MPYKIRFLFIISIFLLACTSKKESSKKELPNSNKPDSISTAYQKPSSSSNDTLVINSTAAVFYNPDSLQLHRIKDLMKKEQYETEVHNCFYLMRNARMVLKKYWPQIHIIETSQDRFLLFIKSDKTSSCVDLNTKRDMCGIFLFNGKKEPELIDMMNVDTALEFYFKK